jgi:uncharacterized Zn finger protein
MVFLEFIKEAMTETLPAITEADIRHLSSEQSFERGTGYYSHGALFELVRQGNELRAYCEGSSYEPYRVSVRLGARGIESTHCTCPYDWGGICKHRVALLLAWMHEPESFHTIPPLDELLAERSKEDLITLIKEMLKREPDLVRVLELPVQPDRQTPLDVDAFRRQISYALRHEFPEPEDLATELRAIVETADRFQEAGDWANAGALYALILSEIVPQYGELYDEHGDVNIALQDCAEGLDACLTDGEPDAATRRDWLSALLEAEMKDIDMGGIDLAYPASEVVINHATDEEWSWIEDRVRQVLATKTGPYSRWARECLVAFLARRLEARGNAAQADDLIFELGSPEQQAFLLVQQGRFAEAIAIAQEHFSDLPGLVVDFANALVEAGAGATAEAYLASLLNTRSRSTYLAWLAHYAQETGNLPAALDWWRQSMRETPHFDTYQALRDLAKEMDGWDQVRRQILAELEQEQAWSILIEIALDEEDVPRALELLPRLQRWYGGEHELRVARAAEADYPKAALDIYCRRVEGLINARGRGNYQTAAGLLARIRNLYRRQGDHDTWLKYISHLRQEYRRLPALQDEINKAKL